MSGAVTPVTANGHNDDEPPTPLPHDLSARGVAEQIVKLQDKAEAALDDIRELRARVIAAEAAAEQRGGWLLEAAAEWRARTTEAIRAGGEETVALVAGLRARIKELEAGS